MHALSGDQAVVEDALAARPEAFATLVRRYQRLVKALVSRTTHGTADTDDLVQDVFLEAYRKLDTLREPARFKGWLVTLALNRARSWGRRRKVEQDALPRLARDDRVEARAARAAEVGETRQRLLEAIRELPEATQAVVTLRYLEGRNATEIGEILAMSPEAVRMRLSRALRQLRAILVASPAAAGGL